MAVFSWLIPATPQSLVGEFEPTFKKLGLEICHAQSSEKQLYAVALSSRDLNLPVVKVILSRINSEKPSLQIEVRSSEATLIKATRCEEFANALKAVAPPI